VNPITSRPRLSVTTDGKGVVGHAGARLLADLAEATGLIGTFSEALAPSRQRAGGHDPGRVAVDVAVMLADGGEIISDLAVLWDQSELFGPVASPATAWRVLDGIDEPALARPIQRLRSTSPRFSPTGMRAVPRATWSRGQSSRRLIAATPANLSATIDRSSSRLRPAPLTILIVGSYRDR